MRMVDTQLASLPTPAIVYDVPKLVSTANDLANLCLPFHGECYFSVKANRHPAILAAFGAAGWGADVASDEELRCAVAGGFTRIVATSPGLSLDAIQRIDYLGGTVFFDHVEQVGAAARAGIDLQRHGIRVAMPGAYACFGFDMPAERDLLAERFKFRPRKLHLHGGEIGTLDNLAQRLTFAATQVRIFGATTLDLGGGFGVLSNKRTELLYAFDRLGDFSRCVGARLIFEFGKVAVARCGMLVTSVLAVKRRGDLQVAVVDCSSFNLGQWEQLHLWASSAALSTRDGASRTRVIGPTCYEGDVFGHYLNAGALTPGDRLVFAPAGAYQSSIAASLHGLAIPHEFMLDEH